ncbi:hypothetical protein TSUD_262960 [Trifolium subterraneum]|nr:hypothetical protein TSUD_262960 [Trifolium subterraneum]
MDRIRNLRSNFRQAIPVTLHLDTITDDRWLDLIVMVSLVLLSFFRTRIWLGFCRNRIELLGDEFR